ncbi:MAG: hypothetical protein WD491_01085 [Balneolales bacterium]
MVHHIAEYLDETFDTAGLEKYFKIEYSGKVYKLSPKGWSKPPHYSEVFYDEYEETLYLSSLTLPGFNALAKQLNKCGYNLSEMPHIGVQPSMFITAKNILKRELYIDQFYSLF